ncbi:sigma-54-dependent Fis family transcriptional regulator [candidate division KSB1 bacterium]|nr:sigma-54-dependent Fis family transcriptional regulator [candidate division KSB1 bacterium]
MKAADLKLEELVEFKDGSLSLKGRGLILHSLHALAQFRKDIIEILGTENARTILTRFGYFQGQADAAAMKRLFEWENLTELIKAGSRMHTMAGMAKNVIKNLNLNESGGTLNLEIIWYNSKEAEEHLYEFNKSEIPVCWTLVGYFSGYASFCLNKEVYFIEQYCKAQGNRTCVAVGKDADSWGKELTPHLPYFQSLDIKNKIDELTQQLVQKTKLFNQHLNELKYLGLTNDTPFIEIHSKAYRKVLYLAQRTARYDATILITGETGVGKEVLARYIHKISRRSAGPFLAVNCSALPETLLESELFGHKIGAFTGAVKDHIGIFEKANGGTIFLDEIGDISLAMQSKILRVLQEHEIMRVGENTPRKVNIRVISATNKNLQQLITEKKFREDLFYRLRVIEIEVPPLRNRKEDILPLARYFVDEFSKKFNIPHLHLDATCIDILHLYEWPGNVRELENIIERAAILSNDGLILPQHFPPVVSQNTLPFNSFVAGNKTLAQVENANINSILKLTGGNKTSAAKILGIDTSTLWRKLKSKNDQ